LAFLHTLASSERALPCRDFKRQKKRRRRAFFEASRSSWKQWRKSKRKCHHLYAVQYGDAALDSLYADAVFYADAADFDPTAVRVLMIPKQGLPAAGT